MKIINNLTKLGVVSSLAFLLAACNGMDMTPLTDAAGKMMQQGVSQAASAMQGNASSSSDSSDDFSADTDLGGDTGDMSFGDGEDDLDFDI